MSQLSSIIISDPEGKGYYTELHTLLPESYKYYVESFKRETDGFCVNLRTSICDKEGAIKWLKLYQEKSLTTFRVESTYPENTERIAFKKRYRCQHNTRPTSHRMKKPHEKHTGCSAQMTIVVKQKDMKRSNDAYLQKYPCRITLKHTHNHLIGIADAVRHRTPSEEVEAAFKDLFEKGHSPSSALDIFKIELQEKHGNSYSNVAADRSRCPSAQWCYQLYYKLFRKNYGEPTGEEMLKSLQTFINEYNEKCGEPCAAVNSEEGEVTVAICTPLMKRVHLHLKSASEIVFIDSSGNMDRHNSRVFLMVCPSVAGSLPLGIFITYSESEHSICKGFKLLKTLLPDSCFFGQRYPKIIITDDCQAERNSLRLAFPSSKLFLCTFHLLQAFLRYLQCSKNGVHRDDKVFIYKAFQELVYCDTVEALEKKYSEIKECSIVGKYKNILKYLSELWTRSSEWALCYRIEFVTRGNNTNNYVEASFRILKDKILRRTKVFSVVQLFDFLSRNYENYYVRKLSDVVNNRYEGYTKSKYHINDEKIINLHCEHLSEDLYKVVSGETEYIVNHKIDICTCKAGCQGAPCKHQYAVVKKFNLSSNNFIPRADSAAKENLYLIMTGEINTVKRWYNTLQNVETSCTTTIIPEVTEAKTAENLDTGTDDKSNTKHPHNMETNIIQLKNRLQKFCGTLSSNLDKKPDVFYYAIDKFINKFDCLKTESALVSALHTFGAYSGAAVPIHKNLQGGKIIGVQPSALSRRSVVGGRHALQSGRPPKNTEDHTYGKQKRFSDFDLPHKNKSKAPHSLSPSMDNN